MLWFGFNSQSHMWMVWCWKKNTVVVTVVGCILLCVSALFQYCILQKIIVITQWYLASHCVSIIDSYDQIIQGYAVSWKKLHSNIVLYFQILFRNTCSCMPSWDFMAIPNCWKKVKFAKTSPITLEIGSIPQT